MKNRSFLLMAVALFLCGCNGGKRNALQEEKGIPVIDLSSDNVVKVASLPLSEAAAKVEIVPLEVTDESLLGGINNVKVTDTDIFVKHGRDQRLFRFSRSGKFLNTVGKVGQGPEEYSWLIDFFVDESNKEIYIHTAAAGIKVYDYEGNYKRTATQKTSDELFLGMVRQLTLYDGKFFMGQNMPFISKPVPKDSVWSFVWVEPDYQMKKMFKNPAYVGREEELVKNGIRYNTFVNYWVESGTQIDTYGNQMTLKYPDTDTIYRYDNPTNELVPQYIISTSEEKGDYAATHLWIKERGAFDYFNLYYYCPSKNHIYLQGSKGLTIYTYCYDKTDGSVRVTAREGELFERKLREMMFRRLDGKHFILDNDLCGGSFYVDYRSQGKYWIDVLAPDSEDNWIDVEKVKASAVKDESLKQEFVRILESVEENSNPILVIATLE